MADDSAQQGRAMAIAATFTAEPLLPPLTYVLGEAGIPHRIVFAPYNQVFQELLSDASALAKSDNTLNVLLFRVEDLVRDITNANAARALISRSVGELAAALTSHARRTKIPTLLGILPPSSRANPSLTGDLRLAHAELVSFAKSLPGIVPLAAEEIDFVSEGERYDGVSDELAHIPYTQAFYASIALAIARKVHSLVVPSRKVLVLDCDNTLWRGVVGEDGIYGISITPAFAALHHFAAKVHSQGVLLCLVSKNSERDVLDVFEKRSDVILTLDQVVAHRINWEPKTENIRSLATALNLGLDSFVFLDDNPIECGLMRAELPQVLTLQVPPEDEIESFLSHLWVFDKDSVTDEDQRRTQMYKENAARVALEESVGNIREFIASLQVVIDIDQPDESDWPRLAQLTQRTNQFNFTTRRRTEAELRAIIGQGDRVLRVRVRDRFGDYGLVGAIVASPQSQTLQIDTFLLSCRVLGRGVEHGMLRKVGELATELNLAKVSINYTETAKNEPARAFIESVAANYRSKAEPTNFLIPSAAARSIEHRPGHDPEAVIAASKSADKVETSNISLTGDQVLLERYLLFAKTLTTGSAVQRALAAQTARMRTLTSAATSASTATERQLLELWEAVLGIQGIGIDDDYAALGGSSLQAAQLFAEVVRSFGVHLPLTTILVSPTIRSLARQIEQQTTSAESLVELKPGHARHFFLVHDGDGETLLYGNLARRLPDDMAVFGVEPRRLPDVPLAHTSVEQMAGFYIDKIRNRQPHGPYFLGGMCAGGVIAYEIANQLTAAGERVELVAILDAATPQASRRPGRIAKQRLGRFSQLFAERRSGGDSLLNQGHIVLRGVVAKIWNATKWEIARFHSRWSVRLRFLLLERLLKRQRPWPNLLTPLTVRQIYEAAEANYTPKPMPGANVVLVRARAGEGADTPYRDIYSDDELGWRSISFGLRTADVEGGHFSMLQEPFVESLSGALNALLADAAPEVHRRSSVKEAV